MRGTYEVTDYEWNGLLVDWEVDYEIQPGSPGTRYAPPELVEVGTVGMRINDVRIELPYPGEISIEVERGDVCIFVGDEWEGLEKHLESVTLTNGFREELLEYVSDVDYRNRYDC